MIAEAKRLHQGGLSYARMRSFGLEYRALADLLEKRISRKEFEERLCRDIRRYAKRQFAYWRRNTDINWIEPNRKQRVVSVIRSWSSSGR